MAQEHNEPGSGRARDQGPWCPDDGVRRPLGHGRAEPPVHGRVTPAGLPQGTAAAAAMRQLFSGSSLPGLRRPPQLRAGRSSSAWDGPARLAPISSIYYIDDKNKPGGVAVGGTPHILIVGAGYGGMHTALRLGRLLRPGEATVTVADPRSYMTYQPLLGSGREHEHVIAQRSALPVPGTEVGDPPGVINRNPGTSWCRCAACCARRRRRAPRLGQVSACRRVTRTCHGPSCRTTNP